MRRTLLCLIFLLIITSAVYAQPTITNTPTGQFYKNDAFKIDITFPNSWKIEEHQGRADYLTFSAYSPTYFPVIGIISGPHEEAKQNKAVTDTSQKNTKFEFKVEDEGSTTISGQRAKWNLNSFTDHASIHIYTLMYFIKTDHNDYVITMQGNYNDYKNNRIIFDEVINTLNILP